MARKLALVSVFDKQRLAPFCRGLTRLGYDILSTGGTLQFLKKNKIRASSLESYTGFPEILDGRVKTLHPKVHGGLLFLRQSRGHKTEIARHGIRPINMLVVNLYPFEAVTRRRGVKLSEAVGNIDIGGPSMLRSAAKNFESVAVVSDPLDYDRILDQLRAGRGALSLAARRALAEKAFLLTSRYDALIGGFLGSSAGGLPSQVLLAYDKVEDLRYGENPHQKAALYRSPGSRAPWEQLHGKELSYNNLLDRRSAARLVREFDAPAACVIKHNNPCGAAAAVRLEDATRGAVDCDPESAFGGVVGLNRKCSVKAAALLLDKLRFFEVLTAPDYDPGALRLLKQRKNLRVLKENSIFTAGPWTYHIQGADLLLQEDDVPKIGREKRLSSGIRWVTRARGERQDLAGLLFAWKCAKHVKSNAIVLVQGTRTVGIGAGQMSRVDAVRIACEKAGPRSRGAILASDGFFPMPDNVELAARHHVRLIIQPGGSIRDSEVIDACNFYGIGMCFTGRRHFKH